MKARFHPTLIAALAALALSGCQSTGMQQVPSYEEAPTVDMTRVLDAPAAPGSVQQASDERFYGYGRTLRDAPRANASRLTPTGAFPSRCASGWARSSA